MAALISGPGLVVWLRLESQVAAEHLAQDADPVGGTQGLRDPLQRAAGLARLPVPIALAEFPDPAHPAHRAAVAVKAWVRERLGQLTATLAGDGRAARPELLADQLSLVMEGTYASAQALAADGPARQARTVAEPLLDVSR